MYVVFWQQLLHQLMSNTLINYQSLSTIVCMFVNFHLMVIPSCQQGLVYTVSTVYTSLKRERSRPLDDTEKMTVVVEYIKLNIGLKGWIVGIQIMADQDRLEKDQHLLICNFSLVSLSWIMIYSHFLLTGYVVMRTLRNSDTYLLSLTWKMCISEWLPPKLAHF